MRLKKINFLSVWIQWKVSTSPWLSTSYTANFYSGERVVSTSPGSLLESGLPISSAWLDGQKGGMGWRWWRWWLAFPCFLSIEPSDAEKSRSPLSPPRLVTSINAVAERRDESKRRAVTQTHAHSPSNTHKGRVVVPVGVWLIHLYFIIMLRGSNPHKAFVSVLLWVLTSCYLCPWCCSFVSAVVSVYCLLSLEINCLVEAAILITHKNSVVLCFHHTWQGSSRTSFLACNCQLLWSCTFHIHNT